LINSIQTLSRTLAANHHHHHHHHGINHDDNHDHDNDVVIDEDDRRWRRYSLSLETVLQGIGAVNDDGLNERSGIF